MPHVSKIKLNYKSEQKLIENLELILMKINKLEKMNVFLTALLTPTEKLMLAKRMAVVVLLKEGLSESDIANCLHVTRVTVSRLQLFLEARGEGYEIALKVLENEKLLKEFKTGLLKLTKYSVKAAGGYVTG